MNDEEIIRKVKAKVYNHRQDISIEEAVDEAIKEAIRLAREDRICNIHGHPDVACITCVNQACEKAALAMRKKILEIFMKERKYRDVILIDHAIHQIEEISKGAET